MTGGDDDEAVLSVRKPVACRGGVTVLLGLLASVFACAHAPAEERRWCSVDAARADYRGCYESETACREHQALASHRCELLVEPYCFDDGAFFQCFERAADCRTVASSLPHQHRSACMRAWPHEMSR